VGPAGGIRRIHGQLFTMSVASTALGRKGGPGRRQTSSRSPARVRKARKQLIDEIASDCDHEFLCPGVLENSVPESLAPPASTKLELPDLINSDEVKSIPNRGDDRPIAAGDGLVVEPVPADGGGYPILSGDSGEQTSAAGPEVNKIVADADAALEDCWRRHPADRMSLGGLPRCVCLQEGRLSCSSSARKECQAHATNINATGEYVD